MCYDAGRRRRRASVASAERLSRALAETPHRVPPALTRENDPGDLGVLLRSPICAQADSNTAGIAKSRALAAEGRTAHTDD
jgi:hypothetical protein